MLDISVLLQILRTQGLRFRPGCRLLAERCSEQSQVQQQRPQQQQQLICVTDSCFGCTIPPTKKTAATAAYCFLIWNFFNNATFDLFLFSRQFAMPKYSDPKVMASAWEPAYLPLMFSTCIRSTSKAF